MSNPKNLKTDNYNICTNKTSILNLLSQHEKGFLSSSQYRSDCTKIKVSQFPKLSDYSSALTDSDEGFYWRFLRNGTRNDIIAVCWNYNGVINKKDSAIGACQFAYRLADTTDSSYPFVIEISKTYQIFPNMQVTDTADLWYENKKPLLIVGEVEGKGNKAIMTCYKSNYVQKEYEWIVDSYIYCCTSVKNSEDFALGCVNGFYVSKNLRLIKKYCLSEDIIATDFNDDGNLLFISCNQSGIQICDMRENIEKRRRNLPPYIKERAIEDSSFIARRMKLLSDQVTLIVSDEKGYINKVDLRMQKCVFQYPDHQSFNFQRPLNIDEDLDLICAVGEDSCCRLWSLGSGKLNWCDKIPPVSNNVDAPVSPHACIVSSERRWFVAVVQNDTVIPIVPDEDEMNGYRM